jgi:hypothetical protein
MAIISIIIIMQSQYCLCTTTVFMQHRINFLTLLFCTVMNNSKYFRFLNTLSALSSGTGSTLRVLPQLAYCAYGEGVVTRIPSYSDKRIKSEGVIKTKGSHFIFPLPTIT